MIRKRLVLVLLALPFLGRVNCILHRSRRSPGESSAVCSVTKS